MLFTSVDTKNALYHFSKFQKFKIIVLKIEKIILIKHLLKSVLSRNLKITNFNIRNYIKDARKFGNTKCVLLVTCNLHQ